VLEVVYKVYLKLAFEVFNFAFDAIPFGGLWGRRFLF
jgi:hypothetical protein